MCRDPRNQFRAWGGGGKCAPQSRAYPTITGDEGGNNEALSRRCALRIQNKRWRRRHGWIIRTRVPGGGRLRGGSPPLCLEPDESAPQTSVKHRRFQQDNELFCSGERFHSVLSSVLTGEGGGQKNRGRGYLTLSLSFSLPLCAQREREKFSSTLRCRRSSLYRWRQFYLAPRPQSPAASIPLQPYVPHYASYGEKFPA